MTYKKISPIVAARKLIAILQLDKKEVSAIYIYAILAGLVQLVTPLGIQSIIGFVMAGALSTSIVVLIAVVVLGVFLNGLFQIRQLQIIEKIKQKIYTRDALSFANKIPHLNIEKLDNYYLPELVNRFFDTITLQKGIEKILLEIPAAFIQILFGIILLSLYHPVFIAFGILLVVLLYVILATTLPKGFTKNLLASDYKYKTAAWLQELARVIKTFKYAKKTSLHIDKTDDLVSNYLIARTSYFKILLTQFWSLVAFKIIITAAMLIVGVYLLLNQQINIGQFIAADIVILAVISSVEKLILTLDKAYDTLTAIEKLDKIKSAELESAGTDIIAGSNGMKIDFKNVSFNYPNGKNVLTDINVEIQAGEKVLIVGNSGSGKSTLLRLLTGTFTNFSGAIRINNIALGSYAIDSLRSNTGVLISQQDIFQGTIRDNITMGDNSISNEELYQLTKSTGLESFIGELEIGFDTEIDPAGKKLPEKIKQGILLARALFSRKTLLLLENPFDGLEANAIETVNDMLANLENVTMLVTASKNTHQEIFDKVIYLENGSILSVESKNK
ncbi:MAG: ATP-binding cassette domain-containing protein [Sediminibacterium sp.]|nr:ATP-binding cassette domain-containing protein [Sediminibacterium sp.]